MVAFKTQFVRRKVNSNDTCRGLSLSCPIMFLHSMSDCCSRSSPVSQSLTRPPISTVTMPPLSHSASRASVSETADIHAVYGERDSALKTEPRGKVRNHAKQAGGTRTCAILPPTLVSCARSSPTLPCRVALCLSGNKEQDLNIEHCRAHSLLLSTSLTPFYVLYAALRNIAWMGYTELQSKGTSCVHCWHLLYTQLPFQENK